MKTGFRALLYSLTLVWQFAVQCFAVETFSVSEQFSNEQKDHLEKVESYIFSLNIKNNINLISLIESSEPHQWIHQRINYIIPRLSNFDESTSLRSGFIQYPYINDLLLNEGTMFAQVTEGVSLMANRSAGLYLWGQERSQIAQVDLGDHFPKNENVTPLAIDSPRAGLVDINSEELWGEFKITEKMNGEANLIQTAALLFHEARHSDGHLNSLGFSHVICPENSDYPGVAVCDRPYNGSYAISAEVINHTIDTCQSCSEKEKEILQLMAFDFELRVINDNSMTIEKKEQINDYLNELDILAEQKYWSLQNGTFEESSKLQERINIIDKQLLILQDTKSINNTYWDPAPEGLLLPN